MGQTASQIENHIEDQREDLSSNLRELENKVKSVTDWRHQFESRPLAFIGLAFGGGILLAKVVGASSGGGERHRHYYYGAGSGTGAAGTSSATDRRAARASSAPSPVMEQAQHAWENIKGALVGIAATRLKDYVEEIVPGFSAQYQEVAHSSKAHAGSV
jgi:hypothetical protein